MMRAVSKQRFALQGLGFLCASAAGVGLTACSSAPLQGADDSAADSAGTAATAGSGVVPSGGTGGAAGNAPAYTKQAYPAGPYGVGVHATLENFAFLGWSDPVAADYDVTKMEEVRVGDYYDPDGSKNIRLIWINASAVWCSVCRAEMTDIRDNGIHAKFGPRGVQMIVTLFEDNKSGPAKPLDLHNWGDQKQYAIDFPLLLDPSFKLGAFFTSDATPLNMLVDARTMKVIDATMGYSSDYWQRIDKLLTKLK
jgi:hypothetical protein